MAFNVLIVDDSSSMRAVITRVIKISGFNVGAFWEAEDGKEAMKLLTDQWVDLVLTDINMPNMNGLELIKAMKEDDALRSIPVVVVTTEGSKKRMQESKRLGASGFIKKPFQPEDIREILSCIMGEKTDGQGDLDEEYGGGDF